MLKLEWAELSLEKKIMTPPLAQTRHFLVAVRLVGSWNRVRKIIDSEIYIFHLTESNIFNHNWITLAVLFFYRRFLHIFCPKSYINHPIPAFSIYWHVSCEDCWACAGSWCNPFQILHLKIKYLHGLFSIASPPAPNVRGHSFLLNRRRENTDPTATPAKRFIKHIFLPQLHGRPLWS